MTNEISPLDESQISDAIGAALSAIASAQNLSQLKQIRSEYAGDSSSLALANRVIGSLPPDQRKQAGKLVGQARGTVNQALAARQSDLEEAEQARALAAERVDVTLPTERTTVGARHPLQTTMEALTDVFVGMGWEVAEGPELEAEWYNFDALNFGPDHPARQMQDTFFVDPPDSGEVMRTHTSPIQARALLRRDVPIYVVCPGKVFRTDELDATHTPVFHQLEGIAIDKGLTMAHLRGTLDHMVKVMFGEGIKTRLRPAFFPFTEPSAELDFQCFLCHGEDPHCRTCGGLGWIEWLGCGMVDPNVLIACGIDPDVYSGFAFGAGVERALMFRNGVADMHDMVEGDIRFSLNYGMES